MSDSPKSSHIPGVVASTAKFSTSTEFLTGRRIKYVFAVLFFVVAKDDYFRQKRMQCKSTYTFSMQTKIIGEFQGRER